jgi:2-polyprenyl-3-methyl-5-hydroxy-6-metoxy-1,4-benzoquinol methylase
MIHYTQCPVCKNTSVQSAFSAKDHTVSKLMFVVCKCNDCEAMFTQDIPSQDAIGAYYASENYVSHSDTQKGFVNKLYHLIRKRTLISKKKLVSSNTGLGSGNILDVGCGTGSFLHTMNQSGWKTTGLEPDEAARLKARSMYQIEVYPSDEIYKLPAASYDAITLWHVLEHVHELHEYTEQLKRILKVSGKLFIAVPNYTSYDAKIYKENWAAYDVPRHLYHFSPKSMKLLMEMHGLRVEKKIPMWFDAFYVSMLSEQYKNGNGNLLNAIFTGFLSNVKTLFNKEKCSSIIYIVSKTS